MIQPYSGILFRNKKRLAVVWLKDRDICMMKKADTLEKARLETLKGPVVAKDSWGRWVGLAGQAQVVFRGKLFYLIL